MNKVCFDCDDPVIRIWEGNDCVYQSTRTGDRICNMTGKPHVAMYDIPKHGPRRGRNVSGSRKSGGLIDAIGDIFEGIFDIFT